MLTRVGGRFCFCFLFTVFIFFYATRQRRRHLSFAKFDKRLKSVKCFLNLRQVKQQKTPQSPLWPIDEKESQRISTHHRQAAPHVHTHKIAWPAGGLIFTTCQLVSTERAKVVNVLPPPKSHPAKPTILIVNSQVLFQNLTSLLSDVAASGVLHDCWLKRA